MTQARARGTFDNPEAYERFMGRWSAKLAALFLDFAGINDGDRVLDVGSGTGNLALHTAARAPRAQVIGIDPSPAFVEFARSRVAASAIRFEVGDAQVLPFPASSFDRVFCQLVLNFIRDSGAALAAMRRVTRPGGTIAATLWDIGRGMRMLDAFWEAVGPGAGDGRFGERPTAYTKEEVAALWNEAGLADVTTADLTISTEFASFDDYWSPFLLGQGPAGAYAVSLTHGERSALRARLRERVLGSRADGPFSLAARAFAVRGIN